MDTTLVWDFVSAITTGGQTSIIVILIVVIVALFFDRRHLVTEIKDRDEKIAKKEERFNRIVDDYYQGNITIAEALNGLKMVLVEIRAKF